MDSTTADPPDPAVSQPTVQLPLSSPRQPTVVTMDMRDPLAGQPHFVLHAEVKAEPEVKEELMIDEEEQWRRNSAGKSQERASLV